MKISLKRVGELDKTPYYQGCIMSNDGYESGYLCMHVGPLHWAISIFFNPMNYIRAIYYDFKGN